MDMSNDVWIARVKSLLIAGFGVEDIAKRLECDVRDVRAEVHILREYGVLENMFVPMRHRKH